VVPGNVRIDDDVEHGRPIGCHVTVQGGRQILQALDTDAEQADRPGEPL
jgi:hypothetical protein